MKTKMFFGNQYVGSFRVTGKETFTQRWSRRMKRAITGLAIVQVLVWSGIGLYQYGKLNAPVVVKAQEVVREVQIETEAPVMARIAKCESGNSHTDPKTGQVLIRFNQNGSYDQGVYQINSIHNKQATKMGLDLTKKEDNIAYANYLYKNSGTESWFSSKACWNK